MLNYLLDKSPLICSGLICAMLFIYAIGCQPTTDSLITPGEQVTRAELNWEIESLMSKSKIRIDQLDRQQELRNLIFQQTIIAAETGAVNPIGLITSMLAVLGIGATADDIRLRKQRNAGKNTS